MSKTGSGNVIEAREVSAGYSGHLIWADASFSIGRGEFVGVLGPNGAGKTTLLRLLLGLLKPLSGELQLLGETPRRGSSRVGYVPQRRPVDSEMTIEALELVRLGLNGNQWGLSSFETVRSERGQALAALQAVDAESLAHRSLGGLSGGELQRVFLAQAIVGQPDVLLLDEPLANLDIRRETELVQLIHHLVGSQHISVLLIAHDINPLLPVLDRVIYVAGGHIATGPPSEVITSEKLSQLYGAPIEVVRGSRGRIAVLGTEEAAHHA